VTVSSALDADPTGEVTELLQQLIRNGCVNDGTASSGHEVRSSDVLADLLADAGMDVERYESAPGRASMIGRLEGTDPTAPTLLLMGHTDVVPFNESRWQRDPLGGELVDGFVWGRGAVDMLNLTSSMAVAVRRLVASGWRPRGGLTFFGVADEEAQGILGAKWLTEREPDALACDYVVTEFGGMQLDAPGGPKLPVMVAEKGPYWAKLRVKGTPGHGSQPYRTDNALVKAAAVVERIAAYEPRTTITETWRRHVDAMELPADLTAALLDPAQIPALLELLPIGPARQAHACTHCTFSPNILHAGVKTNVIPDLAEVEVDIRALPGQDMDDVRAMIAEAVGDLADHVEIAEVTEDPSSESPIDTPLWAALERVTAGLVPGSAPVPMLLSGATDARFFRRRGVTAYGFGLYSGRIPYSEFLSMFHGDDERVDQESLRLSTNLWERLALDLLG
jgi:acetylornithine deacetylase/succinyl-diaminopimelate desuccinylase-like protein